MATESSAALATGQHLNADGSKADPDIMQIGVSREIRRHAPPFDFIMTPGRATSAPDLFRESIAPEPPAIRRTEKPSPPGGHPGGGGDQFMEIIFHFPDAAAVPAEGRGIQDNAIEPPALSRE